MDGRDVGAGLRELVAVLALGLAVVLSLGLGLAACVSPPEPAVDTRSFEDVRRVVAALDDVAGEYHLAVGGGAVRDPVRMKVFDRLMHDAGRYALHLDARDRRAIDALAQAIAARRDPADVEAAARRIRAAMLTRRHLALAPAAPPSRARAQQLWSALCAGCHGDGGVGDGAQGLYLEPEPKNFQDPEIMLALAPSRAFSRITDGMPGTAMPSWGIPSNSERWGLAALVFSFRHDDQQIARGRALAPLAGAVGTWTTLSDRADAELLAELTGRGLPPAAAEDVLAYVRAEVAFAPIGGRLSGIRTELARGHEAYLARRERDAMAAFAGARRAARPAIAALAARDRALAARLAEALARLHGDAGAGALDEVVTHQLVRTQALLDRAEPRLGAPAIAGTARLALERAALAALAAGLLAGAGRRRAALLVALAALITLAVTALAAGAAPVAAAAAALALAPLAAVAALAATLAARAPAARVRPLAVVLAAGGAAALAGQLGWHAWVADGASAGLLPLPHVELLGLHPTVPTLAGALAAAALAAIALVVSGRRPAPDRRG